MAEEICINDILGMKKSKAKIANRINVIETKYLPPPSYVIYFQKFK